MNMHYPFYCFLSDSLFWNVSLFGHVAEQAQFMSQTSAANFYLLQHLQLFDRAFIIGQINYVDHKN